MKNSKKNEGQVLIEFTFCFVMLLLLLYGCVMAFRWAGLNLVERQVAHETTLSTPVSWSEERSVLPGDGPFKQLLADFAAPTPMNLVFNKWQ